MILGHIIEEIVYQVTSTSKSIQDAESKLSGLEQSFDIYIQKTKRQKKFADNFEILDNIQNKVNELIKSESEKLKESK